MRRKYNMFFPLGIIWNVDEESMKGAGCIALHGDSDSNVGPVSNSSE
jgi:hypothetical protein